MNKATIRNLASTAILVEHPELVDIVEFDIEFLTASPCMCGFDLIIHLNGPDAWKTLQQRLGHEGRGSDFATLDTVLDHYRITEAPHHFVHMGCKWMIGDGDDQSAVRVDGHDARVWVRTWWEKPE